MKVQDRIALNIGHLIIERETLVAKIAEQAAEIEVLRTENKSLKTNRPPPKKA